MSLVTKDPFMMRRAGWSFIGLFLSCVYAAWAFRDDGAGILTLIAVLGLGGLISGPLCLRRADELKRPSNGE